MRRIIAAVCILIGIGAYAQETGGNSGPGKGNVPRHWWEWFHGLSTGLEGGAHEYPLKVWYPEQGTEGYSIRSFYITHSLGYERTIADLHADIDFEATMDIGAADPGLGVKALNAKDADRKDRLTLYLEQKTDYPISPLIHPSFPGLLSVYLNSENYVYLFPDFPVVPGVRPQAGKKADGMLEPGNMYGIEFFFGKLLGKIGAPVNYLRRFNDGIGVGLNVTTGYAAPSRVGLRGEITARLEFLPDVRYGETEFLLAYDWKDFSAEVDVTALGAFESVIVSSEALYRFQNFTFKLGVEVSGIGIAEAFSPYMGLTWSY